MNISLWFSIFRFLSLGALFIAFVSGIGVWYFGSRLDEQKNVEIGQLKVELKKASKGISTTYDFNGTKRVSTRPGYISIEPSEEINVFNKMLEFAKVNNLQDLVNICEEWIQKNPEWITPYYFAGAAYSDLGNISKARSLLEYVLENAPNDPSYAKASEILDKLNSQNTKD